MADTQQWLYRIQPTRPEMLSEGSTSQEDEITSKHFRYLKGLMEQGVVLLAGRTLNTDNSSFGIIIFKAEDEAAARAIVTMTRQCRPNTSARNCTRIASPCWNRPMSDLIEMWHISARITRYILDAVPPEALGDKLDARAWTVGRHFAHLHNNRWNWRATMPISRRCSRKFPKNRPGTKPRCKSRLTNQRR